MLLCVLNLLSLAATHYPLSDNFLLKLSEKKWIHPSQVPLETALHIELLTIIIQVTFADNITITLAARLYLLLYDSVQHVWVFVKHSLVLQAYCFNTGKNPNGCLHARIKY